MTHLDQVLHMYAYGMFIQVHTSLDQLRVRFKEQESFCELQSLEKGKSTIVTKLS